MPFVQSIESARAERIGVDAFDQPAVEEGKVLAKKYLTEGG
jgi:glucose-6-phosphate isomerase